MKKVVTTLHQPEKTRKSLLTAAAEEIRRYGFQATSLDRILSQTGVTKGALYHHFKNKLELGYAVVDEVIRPALMEKWAPALRGSDDPVSTIIEVLRGMGKGMTREAVSCGCPLNNLAQEMSAVDEGFRQRIEGVFEEWRGVLSEALKRGQECGTVRKNLDTRKAALFITCVIEGGLGAAKNAQDPEILSAAVEGLFHYLEALRPRMAFRDER